MRWEGNQVGDIQGFSLMAILMALALWHLGKPIHRMEGLECKQGRIVKKSVLCGVGAIDIRM